MRFLLALIVLIILIQGCYTSKSNYKVTSIYPIPNSNYFLIKIKNNRNQKEIRILSEKKDALNTSTKVKLGDSFNLEYKKYSVNPLISFFAKIRGHSSLGLYIDGVKVYDRDEQLYYAPCLDGLSILKNCKVKL